MMQRAVKLPLTVATTALVLTASAGFTGSHSGVQDGNVIQNTHAMKISLRRAAQETSSSTNAVAMPTDDAENQKLAAAFMRSGNKSAVLEELDRMMQIDFEDLELDYSIHFGETILRQGYYEYNPWSCQHKIDLTKGDHYGVLRSFLFTPANEPHVFKNQLYVEDLDWQKDMNGAELHYTNEGKNLLRLAVRKNLKLALKKVDGAAAEKAAKAEAAEAAGPKAFWETSMGVMQPSNGRLGYDMVAPDSAVDNTRPKVLPNVMIASNIAKSAIKHDVIESAAVMFRGLPWAQNQEGKYSSFFSTNFNQQFGGVADVSMVQKINRIESALNNGYAMQVVDLLWPLSENAVAAPRKDALQPLILWRDAFTKMLKSIMDYERTRGYSLSEMQLIGMDRDDVDVANAGGWHTDVLSDSSNKWVMSFPKKAEVKYPDSEEVKDLLDTKYGNSDDLQKDIANDSHIYKDGKQGTTLFFIPNPKHDRDQINKSNVFEPNPKTNTLKLHQAVKEEVKANENANHEYRMFNHGVPVGFGNQVMHRGPLVSASRELKGEYDVGRYLFVFNTTVVKKQR